jgi:hypothetical protein
VQVADVDMSLEVFPGHVFFATFVEHAAEVSKSEVHEYFYYFL